VRRATSKSSSTTRATGASTEYFVMSSAARDRSDSDASTLSRMRRQRPSERSRSVGALGALGALGTLGTTSGSMKTSRTGDQQAGGPAGLP